MTDGSDPPRASRLWWAIGAGTVIQAISFGSILLGSAAALEEDSTGSGSAFALGFVLVPVAAAVVAFGSAHPEAPKATLKGMGLWLVLALPLGLVNPIAGLCAGFSSLDAVTLRETATTPGRNRAIAVLVATAYTTLLVFLVPSAGVFAGAVTPLLAIRAADIVTERRSAA